MIPSTRNNNFCIAYQSVEKKECQNSNAGRKNLEICVSKYTIDRVSIEASSYGILLS